MSFLALVQKKYLVTAGDIVIKPKKDDLKKCQKLYEKMLASTNSDAPNFIIKQDNDVAAAIWSNHFFHPRLGYVTEFDVAVDKKFQKKGFATKLVEKLKNQTISKLIAKPWTEEGQRLVQALGMKPLDDEYWSWA